MTWASKILAKLPRIFDSTTKIIVWSCLTVFVIMAFDIIGGWKNGLPDAPAMFSTDMAAITILVGYYVWKSRWEHKYDLAKRYGLGKECVEEIIKDKEGSNSE